MFYFCKKIAVLILLYIAVLISSCRVHKGYIKLKAEKDVSIINEAEIRKIKKGEHPSILVRFFNPKALSESKEEATIVTAIESKLWTNFEVKDRGFFNENLQRGTMPLPLLIEKINADFLLELTMIKNIQDVSTFYRKKEKKTMIKKYPISTKRISAKLYSKDNVLLASFLFFYVPYSKEGGSYKIKKKEGSWQLMDENGNFVNIPHRDKAITLEGAEEPLLNYANKVIAPAIVKVIDQYL
ncbi:MAG: hypothetical protein ACRC0A_02425 [Chitinophagaceae bacterium]